MPELTRLFTAIYSDGSEYNQPLDDLSVKHDPNREWNPSPFGDIDHSKLVAFVLSDLLRHPIISVDLLDGHFVVNGISLHPPGTLDSYKLIYYRDMELTSTNGISGEPRVVRYYLGYEGRNTVNGKKTKIILGIDP